jgi:hypothetical protein
MIQFFLLGSGLQISVVTEYRSPKSVRFVGLCFIGTLSCIIIILRVRHEVNKHALVLWMIIYFSQFQKGMHRFSSCVDERPE